MRRAAVLLLLLALAAPATAQPARNGSYAERPEVAAFIQELAERHGFVPAELARVFSRVRPVESILQAIAAPSEKVRSWQDYRALFLTPQRVSGGVAFWQAHRAALERAEREFGVPPEYVVAIIGVETLYGKNTGRHRVIDALATLAFDYPPRAPFFREELVNYLLLARDQGLDVLALRGSYAGAFGIPQFMPGSARRYAVDFDGNGSIDLSRSTTDAIGSVANYLKRHGWRAGAPVALEAQVKGEEYRAFATGSVEARHRIAELLQAGVEAEAAGLEEERAALIELATPGAPSEFRIGLANFYAITRYNRSAFYATAVHDLARAVRAAYEAGR